MNPKTHIGTLFFISVILSGCGTERNVYRLPLDTRGEEKLEKRFEGKKAKMVLADGETVNAGLIRVQDDSVFYLEYGSDSIESVPISHVAQIEARNRSKGLLRGLGYGFVIGTGAGVLVGLTLSEFAFFLQDASVSVVHTGLGFGVAGGIIGMFTGAVAGVREIHTFSDNVTAPSNNSETKRQERK
ncbi:MAG: hypothetical protein ACKVRP_13425 [Bacteroidota bacterium]